MVELLPSDHPEVQRVLHHVQAHPEPLPEEECRADLLPIPAFAPFVINKLLIDSCLERFQAGHLPTAIIFLLSTSGQFPSRAVRSGVNLTPFMRAVDRLYSVPMFGVKMGPWPQIANSPFCQELGVIVLQNAYANALDQVAYAIHRAFELSSDPKVLASVLELYYRQTEYPPRGWFFHRSELEYRPEWLPPPSP